ncbi:hypothetical protein HAX54_017657 [Datura stramonium]|uniref:Uncharacterized protein n=1 Tax=Datura stramonium TaxID=4076 RepID=A0ABS8UND2_DATST|nr:hypothetical protein [Datura stramonium]
MGLGEVRHGLWPSRLVWTIHGLILGMTTIEAHPEPISGTFLSGAACNTAKWPRSNLPHGACALELGGDPWPGFEAIPITRPFRALKSLAPLREFLNHSIYHLSNKFHECDSLLVRISGDHGRVNSRAADPRVLHP